MSKQDLTVGTLEYVSLAKLGVTEVLAKVDTGAFSGALHCTDIKVIRRGIIRKRILKFVPLGDPALASETDQFIQRHIRSATGHRVKRYIIQTEITVKGVHYPIAIGLSDRSDLKRVVLIGRRFLRANDMIVDVRINQELDDEMEQTK